MFFTMPRPMIVPRIRAVGGIRHILVANELASYRQSVAAVLRAMLPDLEVFEADSGDLNREVLRLRPEMVICSRLTAVVRDRVPNWVELYPDCAPFSTFFVAGERRAMQQVELTDLLLAVDRARPIPATA